MAFKLRFVAIVWIASFLSSGHAFAANETRVALVIGNSAYSGMAALRNPANDASDISDKLSGLDFTVVTGVDLDTSSFRRKIAEFANLASNADVAMFFYAGHAVQLDGRNYMIPVDAEIESLADVRILGIDLNQIHENFSVRSHTNLIFLDACRNNPFEERLTRSLPLTRSVGDDRGAVALGKGLGAVSAPSGTFIAFATEPNRTAEDGTGRNSPFTTALLRHMDEPGRHISDMMIDVRLDVEEMTRGRQVPWEQHSLRRQFFFAPGDPVSAPADRGPNPIEVAFQAARELSTHESWRDFIDAHQGVGEAKFFVELAEKELYYIEQFGTPPRQASRISTGVGYSPALAVSRQVGDATGESSQEAVAEDREPAEGEEGLTDEDLSLIASLTPLQRFRFEQRFGVRFYDEEGPTAGELAGADLTRAIQEGLNRHGCDAGAADGVWGMRTRDAAFRFLSKAGVLRIVGPNVDFYQTLNVAPAPMCTREEAG